MAPLVLAVTIDGVTVEQGVEGMRSRGRRQVHRRAADGVRYLLCTALAAGLAGCGALKVDQPTKKAIMDPAYEACVSTFYLPYAVLATAVYGTSTARDESVLLANAKAASTTLDAPADDAQGRLRRAQLRSGGLRLQGIDKDTVSKYRKIFEKCEGAAQPVRDATRKAIAQRRSAKEALPRWNEARLPIACGQKFVDSERERRLSNFGDMPFEDAAPDASLGEAEACRPRGAHQLIPVPVSQVVQAAGWTRRSDIERYAVTRDWRVFVPGFAVEVWSRERAPLDAQGKSTAGPAREYAIVFRGTADTGGWFSDFRVLTALLPIFWDQYRQAEWSTEQIVEQIRRIELLEWFEKNEAKGIAVDDLELKGFDAEFPYITAVGHSLGAGLAKHVYYHVNEVSKVVGFNPTPVDGSRTMLAIERRPQVMQGRRYEPVRACSAPGATANPGSAPASHPPAAMFFLYERGDILTSIAPCEEGPHWGSDGGPVSHCNLVSLTETNPSSLLASLFEQHGMNLLACKLALVGSNSRARAGASAEQARP